jgi:hypothetical protein
MTRNGAEALQEVGEGIRITNIEKGYEISIRTLSFIFYAHKHVPPHSLFRGSDDLQTRVCFFRTMERGVISPFNAGIKSLRATLLDKIILLGILLLEPCILLMYA